MPQNNKVAQQQQNKKKKKKGRSPAHQNTFAYKHNPKSKKTAKILELPNQHVCRRCYDKIEWRKKYRKYKPRTQPGRCNLCCQRNVMAAYHNICTKCSISDKSIQTVEQHLIVTVNTTTATVEGEKNNNEEEISLQAEEPNELSEEEEEEEMVTQSEKKDNNNNNTHQKEEDPKPTAQQRRRACAMCVKEYALPCPDDNLDDEDEIDLKLKSGKRLTLRQRKTLERQKAAAAAAKKNNKKNDKSRNENDDDEGDDPAEEGGKDDQPSLSDEEGEMEDADTYDEEESEDEEEDDPFLRAVGGKGKLLVGEAYQQSLLQKDMASMKV